MDGARPIACSPAGAALHRHVTPAMRLSAHGSPSQRFILVSTSFILPNQEAMQCLPHATGGTASARAPGGRGLAAEACRRLPVCYVQKGEGIYFEYEPVDDTPTNPKLLELGERSHLVACML